jgi:hypothetical protein
VSPFRPSFPPQSDVYPKGPRRSLFSRVTGHESQVTCFHQLAASLSSPKKSTPLQSSKSSLFFGNAGVWGGASRTLLRDTRGMGVPIPPNAAAGCGHPGASQTDSGRTVRARGACRKTRLSGNISTACLVYRHKYPTGAVLTRWHHAQLPVWEGETSP